MTRSPVSERDESARTPTVGELLCFDLYSTSRAVTGFYRPMLERTGLTYPQFLVLSLLWEQDSQPMGALTQKLDLEYNTVSPLVKRMEKAGLVARVTNPQDERSVLVRLTSAGQELRWVAHEMTGELGRALGMDNSEIEILRKLLHRVRAGALS
jgi:MarR family transcriptional regulator, organic hydroperoxide resistance regulator